MIVLGIEATAHTLGFGIINEKGKVLADKRSMYTSEKGGIIPSEAAQHHKKIKDLLLAEALNESSLTMDKMDIIAFSQGPGLTRKMTTVWWRKRTERMLKDLSGICAMTQKRN